MTDVPSRKLVKQALRDVGLSHRQIDAFLRSGWRGVVGQMQSENEEMKSQLAALQTLLGGVK